MDTSIERFWKRITKNKNDCWIINGSPAHGGYGQFGDKYKKWKAHRWAWNYFIGKVPKGKELDHLCRNSRCCNPKHLEPIFHIENVRRGNGGLHWAKKTHCPRGHEYNQINTAIFNGHRQCKTCHKIYARNWATRHRKYLASFI